MVKDLVANSPFIDIGFTQSGAKLNNSKSEAIFDYYKLESNTLEFQIDRDFTDYRITPYFSEDQIKELKILYFQVLDLVLRKIGCNSIVSKIPINLKFKSV